MDVGGECENGWLAMLHLIHNNKGQWIANFFREMSPLQILNRKPLNAKRKHPARRNLVQRSYGTRRFSIEVGLQLYGRVSGRR